MRLGFRVLGSSQWVVQGWSVATVGSALSEQPAEMCEGVTTPPFRLIARTHFGGVPPMDAGSALLGRGSPSDDSDGGPDDASVRIRLSPAWSLRTVALLDGEAEDG
eukprot:scaffold649513_cov36-Prasinocladus_malaysianus.AAC.1